MLLQLFILNVYNDGVYGQGRSKGKIQSLIFQEHSTVGIAVCTYLSMIFDLELRCVLPFAIAVLHRDTGKAVVQIAAIEIAADRLLDIKPPETVLP